MNIRCPRCGERATITKTPNGVEVKCPKCHVAEYGETLEKAVRCFGVKNAEPRR